MCRKRRRWHIGYTNAIGMWAKLTMSKIHAYAASLGVKVDTSKVYTYNEEYETEVKQKINK